jgi:Domain of unknown function (DUF4166)
MQSLYQRLLGTAFDSLDPILKRIHDDRHVKKYSGHCDIDSDRTFLPRLIAKVAGLPSRGTDVNVKVTMDCKDGAEKWAREFGAHPMQSRLDFHQGKLRERLGLVVFTFDLAASPNRIDWHVVSARLWPLPIPITWLIECSASEEIIEGRYTFHVKAHVRGIGMIVHYKGWLVES